MGKTAGGPPWDTIVGPIVLTLPWDPFPPGQPVTQVIGTGRAGRTLQERDCAEGTASASPVLAKGPKPHEGGVGLSSLTPTPKGLCLAKGLNLKQT